MTQLAYDLAAAADRVERELLPRERETSEHPVLIVMSGLPGTGKSSLAARLAGGVGAIIVESDRVRKLLFPRPDYSAEESQIVHRTSHRVIERLLRQGVRVVSDATNLTRFHRRLLYRLAERQGAAVVVVQTVAPERTARDRLAERARQSNRTSDADWSVYQRLARGMQPIERAHFCVDTSRDTDADVKRIIRTIQSLMNGAEKS